MEENKFLEILRKHWSKFVLAILMIACVGAWGERLFNSKKSHSKQDYLTVNQMIERFLKGEPLSLEALSDAEKILKRHPELHPKCDAMLTYMFYFQKDIPKALLYAGSTLDHVKNELSNLFQDYSSTSLLIAEKKYDVALELATQLNSQLRNEKSLQMLQGMNLLRILFLADKIQKNELKERAWAEFKEHPSFQVLSALFHEGSVTLEEYFQS